MSEAEVEAPKADPAAAAAPRMRVPSLPSRERLVELALSVYDAALGASRTYKNKAGRESTIAAPDYRAACEAIKVAATVSGYIGAGALVAKPSREAQQLADDDEAVARGENLDAETALKKLRARVGG